TNQLERLQIETGEIELIAVDGIWPRLSPDGERLAFVTVNPASLANALYVADANGENGMQLISEDRFQVIDVPMFSPDGQWIYFAAAEVRSASQTWWEWLMGIQVAAAHNIPSDWWRIPADGSEPERLTTINEVGLYGEFAENGRFIIFASVSGLYRMQADGSGITQLLQTTAAPSFSWVQK
ncbi:MAG: PD40 domain-containing protein, partial [Anaerolineales bacterium]|nr:PD40 domain-containing protein [Anaerolineales bacterium]